MKIDRVILVLNNNPTYTHFWKVVNKVWKENFNIKPTLIFNGTQKEFDDINLNIHPEDYIIVNTVPEVSESIPDWSVTWSFFWGASQFPDDTCMLAGIDQIPLGDLFFKKVAELSDDKFIVGFSDAYKNYTKDTLGYFNTVTNVLYPSSHLVGKGKRFKEIFEIEDKWEDEIFKVYNSRSRYHLNNKIYRGKLWGLDECYASEKISIYKNPEEIIYFDIFWNYWVKNRIDFCGNVNKNFDINLVKEGHYSEVTTKNYSAYQSKIENIINNLPKYNF
jgi:hypothetical protein